MNTILTATFAPVRYCRYVVLGAYNVATLPADDSLWTDADRAEHRALVMLAGAYNTVVRAEDVG